jgi:hypothetical protein
LPFRIATIFGERAMCGHELLPPRIVCHIEENSAKEAKPFWLACLPSGSPISQVPL